MIDKAERMLAYAHSPVRNSSVILNILKDLENLKELSDIQVLSYDSHRSVIPEVSGEIWIKEFENYNGVFSYSGLVNK